MKILDQQQLIATAIVIDTEHDRLLRIVTPIGADWFRPTTEDGIMVGFIACTDDEIDRFETLYISSLP